jgi:hypothetical protein
VCCEYNLIHNILIIYQPARMFAADPVAPGDGICGKRHNELDTERIPTIECGI